MTDRQYHQNEAENDHGANAPESVDMLSPLTVGSNIGELQRQYQSQYRSTHEQYQSSQRSPMAPDHTEKEAVLVGHDSTGLHIVPSEHKAEYPETVTTASPQIKPITKESATPAIPETKNHSLPADRDGDGGIKKKDHRKILGFSRKVFIPLAVALVIIIAAAIGGGVGGAVASRKSDNGASSSTTSSSSSTVPSSTSSTPTSSTSSTTSASATATIHFLNNQTWPKGDTFAFQGFSRDNFTGVASDIVTGDGGKEFGVDFKFDLHSYEGKVGWHCREVKKDQASGPVPRIKVWCDDTQSEAISDERGCDTPK
ncbi:hypothetical protein VFPPC_14779 [Pochonia chlamydosporia 170]|uniref:Uncharacterized protein n=1 Tax=Pochonia chlamydosporia 170 TaxID=1380566 RepID=A0A179F1Z3_METCM|nr:hypothetical protein VFPPC_14779 [Pochonia chlamydosporia 170]OAQ59477.1 hypothetical protein VFPPC_14779 [Pochonia chlamydosporia 170]